MVLFLLLSSFSLIPPFTLLFPLLYYYISFSYVVYVSKKYLESNGSEEKLRNHLRENLKVYITSYPGETVAILIGQLFLTVLAFIVAFTVVVVSGAWLIVKPLLEGGEVSLWGMVIGVLIALLLYFSVVTSFPIFFGRAMLRGEGFGSTLQSFITSLYAEISWKTMLNWDYLKSSVVISLMALALLSANLLIGITPLAPALAPFVTFLTIHLAYTFGTVACFRLLRS